MNRALKTRLRRWLWPLLPGWPDHGRRILQGPHVDALLSRAAMNSQNPRFRSVFNAGAGEGGYSPLLLKLPGIERLLESDYGYRSCRPRQFDAKQVFFCASLVSIPLANETCDLVLCTEVLEHIEEHEQALDELARVTAPGGWLVITVPTPPALPDTNHVREGYRQRELAGMLTERGFRVVESRFCMHFFFRFVLANWSRWIWRPNFLIAGLSMLDRLLPIGPPMDLLILAQRSPDHKIVGDITTGKKAALDRMPTEQVAAGSFQQSESGVRF